MRLEKYYNSNYVDLERWSSYWHQIREVLALQPGKVLEIGIGNKTVCNYLQSSGLAVTTLDIEKETQPDVVGSVENLPFADRTFDTVLCAEVLEHLPFEKFSKALTQICRVTANSAVITLPHWGRHFSLQLRLPGVKVLKWQGKLPVPAPKHEYHGQHYWEIGKLGYSLGRVKREITAAGFVLVSDYVIFEMPYHHMFVLHKRS